MGGARCGSSCASPTCGGKEDIDIDIDLPEYDVRKLATARDPLAVMEAYRVEIYLRLATVLGIRMCPECPRCNDSGFGCQDRFGCNMRPMGGAMGGMTSLGGATEHQGNGTPHFHCEGHVVCCYQYGTLADIGAKTDLGESFYRSANVVHFTIFIAFANLVEPFASFLGPTKGTVSGENTRLFGLASGLTNDVAAENT